MITRVETIELQNKALPSIAAAPSHDGSHVNQLTASSWATTASCQPGEFERMNQHHKISTVPKTRVRGSALASKIKGVPQWQRLLVGWI